jgi:hypothetical protein
MHANDRVESKSDGVDTLEALLERVEEGTSTTRDAAILRAYIQGLEAAVNRAAEPNRILIGAESDDARLFLEGQVKPFLWAILSPERWMHGVLWAPDRVSARACLEAEYADCKVSICPMDVGTIERLRLYAEGRDG